MTMMIKTAGMVQGTPDWQLDRMYETESARMWEGQQEQALPAPIEKYSNDTLIEVFAKLDTMRYNFEAIVQWFGDAARMIDGTNESAKIASIADTVSDLGFEARQLQKSIKAVYDRRWSE